MNLKKSLHVVLTFSVLLFQIACSGKTVLPSIIAPTVTNTKPPTFTFTPTKTLPPPKRITLTPTVDATHQTWYATAVMIKTEHWNKRLEGWDIQDTQIAQFKPICDDFYALSSTVSPNGEWFSASCGIKRDQKLLIKNNNSKQWLLSFTDFLSPKSPQGISGSLYPVFWSPDGNFLYFSIGLGYSGGGNDCFPRERGNYGLFRLDLATGVHSTVVPSTDTFPGYEIRFSPTGRYYSITEWNLIIADLKTGGSFEIVPQGIIEKMSWSPDGKKLAYSDADCNDDGIMFSAIYVWDSTTNHIQKLQEMKGTLLTPELWLDNSTLRFIGLEFINNHDFYNIYEYQINPNNLVFSGTATPYP